MFYLIRCLGGEHGMGLGAVGLATAEDKAYKANPSQASGGLTKGHSTKRLLHRVFIINYNNFL